MATTDKFKKALDKVAISMMHRLMDTYPRHKIRGEVFWEMRDSVTGATTSGHFKNVVTLDASVLVARLMKGNGAGIAHQCEPNFGVFALAVGTGDVAWNLQNPPSATDTQRSLFNELGRKRIASTSFIDSNGNPSGIPTNVVDFITTFSEAEAVGAITEMGLIGGDVSTNMASRNPVLPPNGTRDPYVSLVGKDTLVNYLTFPVINKPATSTLGWTWRLSF